MISSLKGGGAERVMAALANQWASRGDHVTIITLGNIDPSDYAVAPQVVRVPLSALVESSGAFSALKNVTRRIMLLRNSIRASNPTAVISFMDVTNILTLLACAGLKIPVVVSERVDPRHEPLGRGWSRMRQFVYPRAAAIVVQTTSVASWAAGLFPRSPVFVIPNAVTLPAETVPAAAAFRDCDSNLDARATILAVGRLFPQKGFDLLLQAFARVAAENPAARLRILGEGPERARLENQVIQLGLAGKVDLPGRVSDVSLELSRATVFVMSSRYEGFPNALLEAMAAGCPVISFDCPTGPGDIIRHEQNGILVRPADSEALAAAITRILNDVELRRTIAANAPQVLQDYSMPRILALWDEMLSQVTQFPAPRDESLGKI